VRPQLLFAFDPRRAAILLIGGDKSGEWSAWYDRMVPVADVRVSSSQPNQEDPEPISGHCISVGSGLEEP
jgi:hypothetical protein